MTFWDKLEGDSSRATSIDMTKYLPPDEKAEYEDYLKETSSPNKNYSNNQQKKSTLTSNNHSYIPLSYPPSPPLSYPPSPPHASSANALTNGESTSYIDASILSEIIRHTCRTNDNIRQDTAATNNKIKEKYFDTQYKIYEHQSMTDDKIRLLEAKKTSTPKNNEEKDAYSSSTTNHAKQVPNNQNIESELISNFIKSYALVKEPSFNNQDNFSYYWRDKNSIVHKKISSSTLASKLHKWFKRNNLSLSDSKRRLIKAQLLDTIPQLSESNYEEVPTDYTVFKNGVYYDSYTGNAKTLSSAYPNKSFFVRTCLPYDYELSSNEPTEFNNLLSKMFRDDPNKIQLAYQIIGAIISPIKDLKHIFILQGKKSTGKSTLSDFIKALLGNEKICTGLGLNHLVNEDFKRKLYSYRLVYIDETADLPISPKQMEALKTFSRGSNAPDSVPFKILICTNYKITTEGTKNIGIDSTLKSRIVVLPCSVELSDRTYIKNYTKSGGQFEKERGLIAKKALTLFHKYYENDYSFVGDFKINECIETNLENDSNEDITEKTNTNAYSTENQYTPLEQSLIDNLEYDTNAKTTLDEIRTILGDFSIRDKELGKLLHRLFNINPNDLKTSYPKINGRRTSRACYPIRIIDSKITNDSPIDSDDNNSDNRK